MGIGPFASTIAAVRNTVKEVTEKTVWNYVGKSADQLSSCLKLALESQLRNILPVTVLVTVVEESEEIQLVRYIHEEPADFIQVEVQATLDRPLEYLVLEFHPDLSQDRLGIKFVQTEKP